MRLVVDTNVLVSALLNAGRTPDQALARVCERRDSVLYDRRIADEYRAVLARPKFQSIDPSRAEALVVALLALGNDLGEVPAWTGTLIDPRDRCFVEVAIAGGADAIVTGNTRHYPTGLGFEVLPPAALLHRFVANP
ncbi:MAG: putative toxin-antitoxin system toxin component, PIN family [Deltaproteobacteria bacterium]|nr:putative toxin-antitoxin system toxin component, PIN family [Deltaproteobacteria bacterium]